MSLDNSKSGGVKSICLGRSALFANIMTAPQARCARSKTNISPAV